MKTQERRGLQWYLHPLSKPLAYELSTIAATVNPEKKPSIDALIPKLEKIFHKQDRSSAWGQIALDVTKVVVAYQHLIPKTGRDFLDLITPGARNVHKSTGKRIFEFLADIAVLHLVANIPGPNKFKQYDVAAARSILVEKAQAGTLNEKSLASVFGK